MNDQLIPEKRPRWGVDLRDDQGRELVDCEDKCGALEDPVTLDQFRATLTHYKLHGCQGGCAHGR